MVLYFSGTGNSRYAAKKIAEVSGDQIISINQRLKERDYSPVKSEKALVFVGPVYAGRLPKVMEDYIQKVQFEGTSKAYFIATCAQPPLADGKLCEKALCQKRLFSSWLPVSGNAPGLCGRRRYPAPGSK